MTKSEQQRSAQKIIMNEKRTQLTFMQHSAKNMLRIEFSENEN
jgi:hypothetical protein